MGVHTGDKVFITLRPAPANSGIIFRRIDLNPVVEIPAQVCNIGDTSLCTALQKGKVKIATVEHLLSACAGLGIDNLYVDVTAPELPIMDGSAAPFVFLIQSAGIEEQRALKKFIKITKKIEIKDGDKIASIQPFDGFRVNFGIEYQHPFFNEENQKVSLDFSHSSYVKEISRARTYGFLADYEYVRKNNLAKGASLDNTVVIDDYKILNDDGLRYNDECVRHKVLDVIGDLYLLGHNIIGEFNGYKSGHAMNYRLIQAILANEHAWEVITFPKSKQAPLTFQPIFATDMA